MDKIEPCGSGGATAIYLFGFEFEGTSFENWKKKIFLKTIIIYKLKKILNSKIYSLVYV